MPQAASQDFGRDVPHPVAKPSARWVFVSEFPPTGRVVPKGRVDRPVDDGSLQRWENEGGPAQHPGGARIDPVARRPELHRVIGRSLACPFPAVQETPP